MVAYSVRTCWEAALVVLVVDMPRAADRAAAAAGREEEEARQHRRTLCGAVI